MAPKEHFETVKRDIKIVMDEPNSKQPPPMITVDLAWLDFDAQFWIVPALKCFRSVSRQASHSIGPSIVYCCPLPR